MTRLLCSPGKGFRVISFGTEVANNNPQLRPDHEAVRASNGSLHDLLASKGNVELVDDDGL